MERKFMESTSVLFILHNETTKVENEGEDGKEIYLERKGTSKNERKSSI